MPKNKSYTFLTFKIEHDDKKRKGNLVFIGDDPDLKGGLIAWVGPTFSKVHPGVAVHEVDLAMQEYEFSKEERNGKRGNC